MTNAAARTTSCTIHFVSEERALYTDHEESDKEIALSMDSLSQLTLDVLGNFIARVEETECPGTLLELVGTHLYEFLFPEAAQSLRARFQTLCTSGVKFCVQLEFDKDAWRLAQLPWELLYIRERRLFVAAPVDNELILTRHVPNQASLAGTTDRVMVLVAVSDPESNRAAIHTDGELGTLLKGLRERYKDSFDFKVVRNLDWEALAKEIADVKPTVFHFLGHGERGALWFVRAADQVAKQRSSRPGFSKDSVDGGVLTDPAAVQQLFESHVPHLVILEACESDYDSEYLPGVAQLLVEVVPAVVAMRYKISQPASSRFVTVLYESLADGGYLGDVVLKARRELARMRVNEVGRSHDDRAFVTPVLYMKGSAAVCRPLPRRDEATSQANITQPLPDDNRSCPRCKKSAWRQHGRCEHCRLHFDCPKCNTPLSSPESANWCGFCEPAFPIDNPRWPEYVPPSPMDTPPLDLPGPLKGDFVRSGAGIP